MSIDQSHACFTYGTLMCNDIMTAVCGGSPVAGQSATLRDYSRHPVRGEEYPGIRPAPGACVEGVLYSQLSATALARLDAFEGSQYQRMPIVVTMASGRQCNAWVYVMQPELHHLLLAENWDYDGFLTSGKSRFLERYLGFSRL